MYSAHHLVRSWRPETSQKAFKQASAARPAPTGSIEALALAAALAAQQAQRAPGPSLAEVLTPEVLIPLVSEPGVLERLSPHLPVRADEHLYFAVCTASGAVPLGHQCVVRACLLRGRRAVHAGGAPHQGGPRRAGGQRAAAAPAQPAQHGAADRAAGPRTVRPEPHRAPSSQHSLFTGVARMCLFVLLCSLGDFPWCGLLQGYSVVEFLESVQKKVDRERKPE